MKKLIVTTLVIALVVLGFGAFSVEAQGMKGSRMGNRGINDDFTRPYYQRDYQDSTCFLDLEEEQLDQITSIREEQMTAREEIFEAMQTVRNELREAIFTDQPADIIDDLEKEMSELRAEMDEIRTEHLVQLRNILTEEQLAELADNDYRIGMAGNTNKGLADVQLRRDNSIKSSYKENQRSKK